LVARAPRNDELSRFNRPFLVIASSAWQSRGRKKELDCFVARAPRNDERERSRVMGQALPKPALRPLLPADVPVLAAIFVAAVEELTGEDYSEAQQQAWASAADDEEAFGKRLAGQLTLVATLQNSPVGFASLRGADHIDLLYVHPSAVGQGVASMLCDALEKLAGARGAKSLSVDASDNAQEFFSKRGYVATRRNTVTINGEWLANTTMQKTLAAAPAPGAAT
jgi:putative acetyltransferase